MQFKHLRARAKGSLFLILLFAIGTGIFVFINNVNNSNSGEGKKHATEVNSSVANEESKKNLNENDSKTNEYSKSNGSTSTNSDGKNVTPTQMKPDFGMVDGGEYNNNFHGRVEVYENPFFGMKVNFPEGWTLGDKHEQLFIDGPMNQNKSYLFTAYLSNNYTLGVTAEKFDGEAKAFLENLKYEKYVDIVGPKNIGPDLDKTIIESPIQALEIQDITFNKLKLNYFDVTVNGDYSHSHYALMLKNYIILFQIRSSDSIEVTHETFVKLLNNITFQSL